MTSHHYTIYTLPSASTASMLSVGNQVAKWINEQVQYEKYMRIIFLKKDPNHAQKGTISATLAKCSFMLTYHICKFMVESCKKLNKRVCVLNQIIEYIYYFTISHISLCNATAGWCALNRILTTPFIAATTHYLLEFKWNRQLRTLYSMCADSRKLVSKNMKMKKKTKLIREEKKYEEKN